MKDQLRWIVYAICIAIIPSLVGFWLLKQQIALLSENVFVNSQRESALISAFYSRPPKQEDSQTTTTQKQAPSYPATKPLTASEIIKKWQPRVLKIYCRWDDGSSGTGSGFLAIVNQSPKIITNKHVIQKEDTKSVASQCQAKMPDDGLVDISLGGSYLDANYDFALLDISNPPEAVYRILNQNSASPVCKENNNITEGDSVLIFGYPAGGAQDRPTITDGIISSIEDSYYIISAKIDYGDSGGLAVLTPDDCYFGIPSFIGWGTGNVSTTESYGRVLDIRHLLHN
ncbi:MAG TPA: serine protease [Candidatus Paceibacterota bacterium]|nr:serine protease [Candidatus Paceibacterota bacterium]